MFSFYYDIELNERGEPFINPVNGTENELGFAEHKFMAVQFTLGFVTSLVNTYMENGSKYPISPFDLQRLQYLEQELHYFSDIITPNILDKFKMTGLADKMINQNFDLSVLTEDERDELNYNGIIYHDKIYRRIEGLKVKVLQTGEIFELIGGIDNQHWTKINQ